MEKATHPQNTHTSALKNRLTIGALSLTLATNSPQVFSQKTQSKQELVHNLDLEKEAKKLEKQNFITKFAPILNLITDTKHFPFIVEYKNSELIEKYNLPKKIDVLPKNIDKPTDSLLLILGEKKFKIKPSIPVKVVGREIVENKGLDDPKVIVKIEPIGVKLLSFTIKISCNEFAGYMYNILQIPVGTKVKLAGVHIEEISNKKPTLAKSLLTQTK